MGKPTKKASSGYLMMIELKRKNLSRFSILGFHKVIFWRLANDPIGKTSKEGKFKYMMMIKLKSRNLRKASYQSYSVPRSHDDDICTRNNSRACLFKCFFDLINNIEASERVYVGKGKFLPKHVRGIIQKRRSITTHFTESSEVSKTDKENRGK